MGRTRVTGRRSSEVALLMEHTETGVNRKEFGPTQPPGKSVQAHQESHLKKTVCFRLGERTAGTRITHSAVGKLWACWWHTLSNQTNRRKPCVSRRVREKHGRGHRFRADRMVIQTGRCIPGRWCAFPKGARSNIPQSVGAERELLILLQNKLPVLVLDDMGISFF